MALRSFAALSTVGWPHTFKSTLATSHTDAGLEHRFCNGLQELQMSTEMDWEPHPQAFCFGRFGSLPGEIRQQIYELVLIMDKPMEEGGNPLTVGRGCSRQICLLSHAFAKPHLRLLETCRQVHQEALGIFYKSHTFYFNDALDLCEFLQMTNPRRLQQVRSLYLDFSTMSKPLYSPPEINHIIAERETSLSAHSLASIKTDTLGHTAERALMMLSRCHNLRKLHISVPVGKEYIYVSWLDNACRCSRMEVVCKEQLQWKFVERPSLGGQFDFREEMERWSAKLKVMQANLLELPHGTMQCVEVDIPIGGYP